MEEEEEEIQEEEEEEVQMYIPRLLDAAGNKTMVPRTVCWTCWPGQWGTSPSSSRSTSAATRSQPSRRTPSTESSCLWLGWPHETGKQQDRALSRLRTSRPFKARMSSRRRQDCWQEINLRHRRRKMPVFKMKWNTYDILVYVNTWHFVKLKSNTSCLFSCLFSLVELLTSKYQLALLRKVVACTWKHEDNNRDMSRSSEFENEFIDLCTLWWNWREYSSIL